MGNDYTYNGIKNAILLSCPSFKGMNLVQKITHCMNVIEEYKYLSGEEKKIYCIQVVVNIFEQEQNQELIGQIIDEVIVVTRKEKYKINKKRKSVWNHCRFI